MKAEEFHAMVLSWQVQIDRIVDEMHEFIDADSASVQGHAIEHAAGSLAAASHIITIELEAATSEFIR